MGTQQTPPASTAPPPPTTPAPGTSESKTLSTAESELERAAAPLVSDEPIEEDEDQPAIDVSFEQLQRVWPGLFGGLRDLLGARRWAFFREAVPGAVEGNTIILEVQHDFHLTSLTEDDAVAPIVAAKASDLLGGQVQVRFRLKDHDGAEPDEESVDLSQLEERPQSDPASLLESELGAKVVDD